MSSEMVERLVETLKEIDLSVGVPNYYQVAMAMIEAMREPTLEMLDAGNRAARQARVSGVSGMTIDAQVKAHCARENATWKAMIEAALAS